MFFEKNDGNVEIRAGHSYDSGAIYDDGTNKRVIRTAFVDFGALPNTALKNVAHGLASVDVAYAVAAIHANNGTTADTFIAQMTATNVSITTTSDLSAWTGLAMIQYVETVS
jgi:hypothetical protein